ncbi:hypothetical protein Esti_003329 [Eimeria stiedai]
MAKGSRAGLAAQNKGAPHHAASRKGAPKAVTAAAKASSKSNGALHRGKETLLAASVKEEQLQEQHKNKAKNLKPKKEKRAPLLKGPLIIPEFKGIAGPPQNSEAPEALGARELGGPPKGPSRAGDRKQEKETVETEEKSKTHFWRDRKNRSVWRALQRHLAEEEGPPRLGGAPPLGLHGETKEAALAFLTGALMASGGRHRTAVSLARLERAKPQRRHRL